MKRFRHRVKKDGHVHFEIWVEDSHTFNVRLPEFDYIRSRTGCSTEFERDQLLMFLLAYDREECLRFIIAMCEHSEFSEAAKEKIKAIPVFKGIWDKVVETCE